jgi:hypothetical protein
MMGLQRDTKKAQRKPGLAFLSRVGAWLLGLSRRCEGFSLQACRLP